MSPMTKALCYSLHHRVVVLKGLLPFGHPRLISFCAFVYPKNAIAVR